MFNKLNNLPNKIKSRLIALKVFVFIKNYNYDLD